MIPDISPDTVQEAAQVALYTLMTGISEEYWCAGWMMNLEYDLWGAEPNQEYGQGKLTLNQLILLQCLAEEAGGWWTYGYDGPVFVPMDKWRVRYKDRMMK